MITHSNYLEHNLTYNSFTDSLETLLAPACIILCVPPAPLPICWLAGWPVPSTDRTMVRFDFDFAGNFRVLVLAKGFSTAFPELLKTIISGRYAPLIQWLLSRTMPHILRKD